MGITLSRGGHPRRRALTEAERLWRPSGASLRASTRCAGGGQEHCSEQRLRRGRGPPGLPRGRLLLRARQLEDHWQRNRVLPPSLPSPPFFRSPSVPFRSFPSRSLPFRPVLFRSLPFRSFPFLSVPFRSVPVPFRSRSVPFRSFPSPPLPPSLPSPPSLALPSFHWKEVPQVSGFPLPP